jgi:hypothetical protein
MIVLCNINDSFANNADAEANKATKIMNNKQPFANPQLNSLLPYNLSAKGTLAWKLEYNPDNISGNPVSLLMIDDARVILDYTDAFFAIDTSEIKVLGYRRKSHNSFIVLGEGQAFSTFASYRLFNLKFDSFQKDPETSYFIPGLGDYSNLVLFIPKQDSFIAGIQGTGNPEYQTPIFGLFEKNYFGYNYLWNHAFKGFAVIPPVSIDGNFVLAMNNSIKIIGFDGNIKKEIEDKFVPLSCSIGADGIIYLICKTRRDYLIKAIDFEGNIKWECPTSITKPTQPPVISNESIIYIIGSSNVEAFSNGEKLWEYNLTDDSSPKRASVTNDGMLLVIDGRSLICLNKAGEVVWTFKCNKEEKYMTQPILDSTGKVIVATDKKILAIN